MLKEKRMIPVQVTLYCDECGSEMIVDGSNNPCFYCDHRMQYTGHHYPYIKYIEEDAVTDTREFDDVPQRAE